MAWDDALHSTTIKGGPWSGDPKGNAAAARRERAAWDREERAAEKRRQREYGRGDSIDPERLDAAIQRCDNIGRRVDMAVRSDAEKRVGNQEALALATKIANQMDDPKKAAIFLREAAKAHGFKVKDSYGEVSIAKGKEAEHARLTAELKDLKRAKRLRTKRVTGAEIAELEHAIDRITMIDFGPPKG